MAFEGLSEGFSSEGHDLCSLKRRVLQRDLRRGLQPLNWDTAYIFKCIYISFVCFFKHYFCSYYMSKRTCMGLKTVLKCRLGTRFVTSWSWFGSLVLRHVTWNSDIVHMSARIILFIEQLISGFLISCQSSCSLFHIFSCSDWWKLTSLSLQHCSVTRFSYGSYGDRLV